MELLSTDELNKLLTPLGGDNPCGDNLEYDETYMSLEELRKEREEKSEK